MADYKTSKEAFVSGSTGSTFTHVNLISAAALCSIALYAAIRTRLATQNLLLEWTVLVLPLLLSMTLFAERPLLLCFLVLIPAAILFWLPQKVDEEPLLSPTSISRAPSPSHPINIPSSGASPPPPSSNGSRISITPLPSLTVYRAHMLLMTFLAILAVDFSVFPRSLAKCETFGVSLMDLGVGSFVFSQGVVSAIPLLKDPTYLLAPALPKIMTICKKVLPLFVLGIVRVISVKGTQYPEHESEYGTHWNFFFTMAFIPILQVILHPVIIQLPISLLGFLIALSHQVALSMTPLQRYTLNAPRTNIISANKEGLVSLTGYLAIHLIGLSVGTLLLPPSPSDFRRQQSRLHLRLRGITPSSSSSEQNTKPLQRQDDKTAIELFSYAILWWGCVGVCYLMSVGGGVSRRMANLPYVIWIAAFNTSFIMSYLVLDRLVFTTSISISDSRRGKSDDRLHPDSSSRSSFSSGMFPTSTPRTQQAPNLLEAINRNGLALFLLANVLTGLTNLSISTMYASNTVAMIVLSCYSFALCAVAWMCRKTRLWKL